MANFIKLGHSVYNLNHLIAISYSVKDNLTYMKSINSILAERGDRVDEFCALIETASPSLEVTNYLDNITERIESLEEEIK